MNDLGDRFLVQTPAGMAYFTKFVIPSPPNGEVQVQVRLKHSKDYREFQEDVILWSEKKTYLNEG